MFSKNELYKAYKEGKLDNKNKSDLIEVQFEKYWDANYVIYDEYNIVTNPHRSMYYNPINYGKPTCP